MMISTDYLWTINRNRSRIKRNSNLLGLIFTLIYTISGFILLTYETTCSGTQPSFNTGLGLLLGLLIPTLIAIFIGQHELRQMNQFIDPMRVIAVWNLSLLGILILSFFVLDSLGSQYNTVLDSIYAGSLAGSIFFIFFGMALFVGIHSYIRKKWDNQKYSDYLPYETKISVLLDVLLANLSLAGRNSIHVDELASYLNVQVESLQEILQKKLNKTTVLQGYDTNTGELLFDTTSSKYQ